jgi:protein-S-isoprenylcysteine O-methyltransferase Ste14
MRNENDLGAAPTLAIPSAPPRSATVTWINLAGLASLIAASFFIPRLAIASPHVVLILVLGAPALTIIGLEYFFIKTRIPFRPIDPTGCYALVPPSGLSASTRILLKIVGFAASVAALALGYVLLPIYRNGGADYLIDLVKTFWLPLTLLAPLYIWFVDKRMDRPEDGYFHVGLIVTGQWKHIDWPLAKQHVLQWTVKGFFWPLMLVFCFEKIQWMDHNPFRTLFWAFVDEPTLHNWFPLYECIFVFILFVDVTFASFGYVLTLKLFDSQLRTAEPTTMGWVVCLVCYPPFWNAIEANYLSYGQGGMVWGWWLDGWPVAKVAWSIVILLLYGFYALATVQFGTRFANLTHRGIITNGPYRWFKHPAYVSKNFVWWFFYLPFLSNDGIAGAIRATLLLIGVNLIYYFRAKTEERHLMNDPIYREYAAFMREHGFFAGCRRAFRHLTSPEMGREPKLIEK